VIGSSSAVSEISALAKWITSPGAGCSSGGLFIQLVIRAPIAKAHQVPENTTSVVQIIMAGPRGLVKKDQPATAKASRPVTMTKHAKPTKLASSVPGTGSSAPLAVTSTSTVGCHSPHSTPTTP